MVNDMRDELLTCPFCGNDIENVMHHTGLKRHKDNCYIKKVLLREGFKTMQEWHDAWNQRPSQWVSVDERLPKGDYVRVLFYDSHGVRKGWYERNKFFDETDVTGFHTNQKNITHWMHLPSDPIQNDE